MIRSIRHSEKEDLSTLHAVIDEARHRMAKLGIDQWQDGYPADALLLEDAAARHGYVLMQDGEIEGYCVLSLAEEPCYNEIDGAWESTAADSVVVHRTAVSDRAQGTGLGRYMLEEAAKFAKANGRHYVRLDTHPGNTVMRGFVEHLGYSYTGVVIYDDITTGEPRRVCYEKRMEEK